MRKIDAGETDLRFRLIDSMLFLSLEETSVRVQLLEKQLISNKIHNILAEGCR